MAALSVMLFSILRQNMGRRQVTVEVSLPSEAGEVLDALVKAYPSIAPFRPVMRLAVNQVYADEKREVVEGDEIAVITPVSGG